MFNNNLGLKRKIKLVAAYIAIGISLSYLFVNFEIQAWYNATDLLSQVFYQEIKVTEVNVPHAQDTYQNLIRWTFGKDAKTALAIATAENGTHACGRTHTNKNGTTDIGIFQVNSIHSAKGNLYDCKDNVRVAYQIFKASGFYPWTVYQTGAYKKFLN